MQRARRAWRWWAQGFHEQAQDHADAATLAEYDDLCEEFGLLSAEAKRLEPEITAIRARHEEKRQGS